MIRLEEYPIKGSLDLEPIKHALDVIRDLSQKIESLESFQGFKRECSIIIEDQSLLAKVENVIDLFDPALGYCLPGNYEEYKGIVAGRLQAEVERLERLSEKELDSVIQEQQQKKETGARMQKALGGVGAPTEESKTLFSQEYYQRFIGRLSESDKVFCENLAGVYPYVGDLIKAGATFAEIRTVIVLEEFDDRERTYYNEKDVTPLVARGVTLEEIASIEPVELFNLLIEHQYGLAAILKVEGMNLSLLQVVAQEKLKAILTYGYLSAYLLEAGATLDALHSLEPEFRTWVEENRGGVAVLLKAGVTLEKLQPLDPEFRAWVLKKGDLLACSLRAEVVTLEVLQPLNPEFRTWMLRNGTKISFLLKLGIFLEDLQDLDPAFRTEIVRHKDGITALLKEGVTLEALQGLFPVRFRVWMLINGNKIKHLLRAGGTLGALQGLKPVFRALVLGNGDKVSCLLREGATLEKLQRLEPGFREVIIRKGGSVSWLLRAGATLEMLQGLEFEFRTEVLRNESKVSYLLNAGISLGWLKWLSLETRGAIISNPGGFKARGLGLVARFYGIIPSLLNRTR
jgi:hypothetical protein